MWTEAVGVMLLVLAALLLVPVTVLLVQVVAAVFPGRAASDDASVGAMPRPRVAVLVPAHDEAAGIAAALRSMLSQLEPGDRLVVVADNCSDDTARIARAAGAEVVERRNPTQRGKGYALDHGIRFLEAAPPAVVVIVDADCELHPGSLDWLVRSAARTNRPVQALDLMHAPPGAGLTTRIAAFAWAVKNHARPLGNHRLGLPCPLMGTGMAFPWALIQAAPLASGHIVEDMRLGLDLAAIGAAPLFCPQALVTSTFPIHAQGIAEQRARWEQGHVGMILGEAPRALWRAITRRRPALAAMVLDLSVPPLTMLVLGLVLQAAVDAVFAALGGARAPLALAGAALAMLALAVVIAWWRFGREIVSLGELLRAPVYVLEKLPLYLRIVVERGGKRGWVRARRDDGHE